MEQWRDIAGLEGRYQVSSLGRVRSLDRMVPRGAAVSLQRGRILAAVNGSAYGYQRVGLGRDRQEWVHRLVAAAFLGPLEGMEVDHIDGDPRNNAAANLRIVTHAENMALQRERKPTCQRGHSFADAYWTPKGRRACRECMRMRDRRRRRQVRDVRGSVADCCDNG